MLAAVDLLLPQPRPVTSVTRLVPSGLVPSASVPTVSHSRAVRLLARGHNSFPMAVTQLP